MTARVYDSSVYRWKQVEVWEYSTTRSQWERQRKNPVPGMQTESHLVPGKYLGQGTVWTRSVTTMPLATNSATLASYMWTETPTRYKTVTGTPSGAFGAKTSLNSSSANTHPIVSAVVDSSEPGCTFMTMDSCSGPGMTTAEATATILGLIPWPSGLLPPPSGDKGIMIFDKNTGIAREYFGCVPVTGKPGHFTATVGGYSINNPYFIDMGTTNYATQYKGSNAVVRMHNVLGQIGIDEVRQGKINHALGFTMANAIGGVPASWPALASDGKFPPATWSGWTENGGSGNGNYPGPSPRHGQWGRLPLTVNPLYNPSTLLPYNPLTQLLIKAAQAYGLVGTDTNAFCHAFNTESGNREKLLTGTDPWAASGELATLLKPESPSTAFDVSDFPWNLTEWAPVDWGRPDPDFWLRADEYSAYAPHGGA